MKGKFLTLEGCEGVGKSTQLGLLTKELDRRRIPFLATREPGGSRIAEQIRAMILDAGNREMGDVCEALLYGAARAQHVEEIVRPALSEGKLVLCDRFIDSTFAYQGYAKGLGIELAERLNELAVCGCMPDLTLFLDYPPDLAFRRKGGADEGDRLENLGLAFHRRVYEGYKLLEERARGRFVAVDASGTEEETFGRILALLEEREII